MSLPIKVLFAMGVIVLFAGCASNQPVNKSGFYHNGLYYNLKKSECPRARFISDGTIKCYQKNWEYMFTEYPVENKRAPKQVSSVNSNLAQQQTNSNTNKYRSGWSSFSAPKTRGVDRVTSFGNGMYSYESGGDNISFKPSSF